MKWKRNKKATHEAKSKTAVTSHTQGGKPTKTHQTATSHVVRSNDVRSGADVNDNEYVAGVTSELPSPSNRSAFSQSNSTALPTDGASSTNQNG